MSALITIFQHLKRCLKDAKPRAEKLANNVIKHVWLVLTSSEARSQSSKPNLVGISGFYVKFQIGKKNLQGPYELYLRFLQIALENVNAGVISCHSIWNLQVRFCVCFLKYFPKWSPHLNRKRIVLENISESRDKKILLVIRLTWSKMRRCEIQAASPYSQTWEGTQHGKHERPASLPQTD